MRILVTGGAGFIGSALIRHLINNTNHEVLVIDKLTYAGHLSSIATVAHSPRFSFLRADVCDRAAIGNAMAGFQPGVVAHLAAESHVDRSIDHSDEFIMTNVVGTHVMLECSRTYYRSLKSETAVDFRFHHISTDEVFGSLGPDERFLESTPYDPRSPYSASKAASDHLVRAWGHTFGLPVLVTNCSNNYGPYHYPEKLIPLTILRAIRGETVPIYGDGKNVRDWLHVEDHARALTSVFEAGQPQETYMIGGNAERTNLQVVEAICDVLDQLQPRSDGASYRDQMLFVADRPGHDRRYAVDATKIHRDLGWSASWTFERGIAATVSWFLENRAWWSAILQERSALDRKGLG